MCLLSMHPIIPKVLQQPEKFSEFDCHCHASRVTVDQPMHVIDPMTSR